MHWPQMIFAVLWATASILSASKSSAQPAIDEKVALQICEAFSKKMPELMPAIVSPDAAQKLIENYRGFSDQLTGCLSASESRRGTNSTTFLIENTRYESYWQFSEDQSSIKEIFILGFKAITLADDEHWQLPVRGTSAVAAPSPVAEAVTAAASSITYPSGQLAKDITRNNARSKGHHHAASRKGIDFHDIGKTVEKTVGDTGHTIEKPVLETNTDTNIVEFFYATTRKESADRVRLEGDPAAASSSNGAAVYRSNGWTAVSDYTGERAPQLSFGVVRVRVPEGHHIGNIELPTDHKLFSFTLWSDTLDPAKHFSIRSIQATDEDKWVRTITSTNRKTALVFVHGFNTKFRDAVFRAAQITWDLQFKGAAVLFSWPSRGDIADYLYDKEGALGSRTAFLHVIDDLHRAGYEEIDIIAHSMGNLIAVDALANSAATQLPVTVAQLIMAAPDVDRDMFVQDVSGLTKVTKGLTLYASKNDKALQLSKRIAGNIPRAGDVPDSGPIILPGLCTIDVSLIGAELFGLDHNTFATTRNVLDDLGLLLEGKSPPKLAEIRGYPEPPERDTYFRYAP